MNKMMSIGHSLEKLEEYFKQRAKPIAETIRPSERIIKIGTRTYKVRRGNALWKR